MIRLCTMIAIAIITYFISNNSYALDANDIIYADFEGVNNQTTYTEKANNKNIQFNGDAKISTVDKKNGASSLYVTNGNATIINDGELNLADSNYTIEMWAKVNSVSTNHGLFGMGNTDENRLSLGQYGIGWDAIVKNANVGYEIFPTTHTPIANTWYHVVLQRTATTNKVYINGIEVGTSQATNIPNGLNVYIGQARISSQMLQWTGYIDDLKISKTNRYAANFNPEATLTPTPTPIPTPTQTPIPTVTPIQTPTPSVATEIEAIESLKYTMVGVITLIFLLGFMWKYF